jgi:hypothetical protein
MKFPAVGRFSLFGLVVLALAALFGVAWLSKPTTVSAGQQAAPQPPPVATVSGGARACPAPGAPGSGHETGVAVLSAAGPRAGSGQATVTRLGAPGTSGTSTGASSGAAGPQLARLSQPGTLSVTSVPAAHASPAGSQASHGSRPASEPGGVAVQATGAMAQGLAVEQTGPGGDITAACPGPGTSFWFAAPGQQHAQNIKVYLMNTDSQPSDVDVDILTDTGPLQTGTDSGITVPAHGMVVQSLGALVHGSRAIGLHVRATAGRVSAALSESTSARQTGQWLPAAQIPARQLVIPALPGVGGGRQFYVADPGGSDAQVKMSVVASGGSYHPAGAGSIDIPAGSASEISVPSLGGITGAAVLTSNVPVTASAMVPGAVPGTPGAMTVAAPALQQQGVIAEAGVSGAVSTLELSAPGAAAKVRLVTAASGLAAGGAAVKGDGKVGGGRVISVKAKHTVMVALPRPHGVHGPFAAVLTPLPGSGPVYAGRVLSRGRGTVLGIMPVASALTSVPLPAIRSVPVTATP